MKILYIICIIIIPASSTVPPLLSSFYAYYTTDLGNDSFKFLYTMWFPFDTKTPIRFSIAILTQYVLLVNVMIVDDCLYTIGMTTLPMLFPLIDDIKRDLYAIQQSLKHRKKRWKLAKPLSQFIQFHSVIRQLSVVEFLIIHFHRIIIICETKLFLFRLTRGFSKYWQSILTMICSYFIVGMCSLLLSIAIKMVIYTQNC